MLRLFGVLMVAVAAVAGCAKSTKVAVYPVTGQVLYDGKPAAGVQVFLFPTSAPMFPEVPAHPHGTTGADGKFALGTYTDSDGAAEGSYQIVLFWPDTKDPEEET